MPKYLEFWKPIVKQLKKQLSEDPAAEITMDVSGLQVIGDREAMGYNGKLRYWAQQEQGKNATQVFKDLRQAVKTGRLLDSCPGELELRITDNNTLHAKHRLLTPDDFIERYKGLQDTKAVKDELYKWQLVKANQARWAAYDRGVQSFQDFFLSLDFSNLVYPLARAVMDTVAKAEPAAFEQLLLALYDEDKDFSERQLTFRTAFAELYKTLPDHGDNSFMEGRTISVLLTWRYPERYTIFKDSFYTPYCKAIGVEPAKPKHKVPHYLELVRALANDHLPKHPAVLAARDAMLDESCYPDPNNMILAQDVLYLTSLDVKGGDADQASSAEERKFLKTLRQFSSAEQHELFADLDRLVSALGLSQDDGRVVFHAVPNVPRLGFTIGQAYCFQLGTDKKPKHGFALRKKGDLQDVEYREEFSGPNARVYAYTDVHERVHDHWNDLVSFCEQELERAERSGHRRKNNSYFEKAVFDLEYRASILQGGAPNAPLGLIMVNITWNSNDWKAPSQDKSNHGYVKEGNTPMESWNFDFDNPRNPAGKTLGFVQHTAPPRLEGDNNLVIFHSAGNVVGFYGKGQLLKDKLRSADGKEYNIIGDRSLSLVLANKLDNIKAKGYLEEKQRMGMNGFIYLKEPSTALRMIDEAIELNPAQREQLNALRTWVVQSANGAIEEATFRNEQQERMHSLNTILYGPPGTGKTYHAITHAVAIIDGEDVEVVKKRPRAEVRARYQELFDARLVRAVTFHQSFSYEDFVEGIKPKTHEGEDEDKPKQVTYDVEDGIFKEICSSARTGGNPGAGPHLSEDTLEKAKFYKVSLGQYNNPADDPIYAYCMEQGVIAVGYGGQVDVSSAKNEADIRRIISNAGFKEEDSERHTITVLRKMHLEMEEGDIVLVSAGNSTIRAIGQVTGPYFVDLDAPIRFKQFRKVKWLYTGLELPVEDIYPIKFTMGSLYDLDRKKVKLDYFKTKRGTVSASEERYVLIIDEINRGNVASIFGELITLIEDDKREGEKEAAHVKLPYSKKDFSVPKNLYLLGTMNTADRSVEALDSALRRRFSFVEMPCNEDRIDNKEVAGVKLPDLLKKINERVEQLLDKDHHIGHSYFMGLSDLAGLKRVFKNKVIPLLEEYFHGDAFKVGAVLGDAFVEKQKGKVSFAKGFEMEDYEVKEIHRLKDVDLINDPEVFKAIYAN